MTQTIRSVFKDPQKVERSIQKVIDYLHTESPVLKREVEEYVVTDHISKTFGKMLDWIEASLAGNATEAGAWVSGFYGSGKSSFTKYLGFAFDDTMTIEGEPFVERLALQIGSGPVRSHLKALPKRAQAEVVMLDLATQAKTGAPVSENLLDRVRAWAGLSQVDTIADFEEMVRSEGRWEELLDLSQKLFHKHWSDIHNIPAIVRGRAEKLAKVMYEGTTFDFRSKQAAREPLDEVVKKILRIVRSRRGRENVLFVIDEAGQYVGANEQWILDLQGIVQNFKTQGRGRVLVIATAQQTLEDTNEKTALNSPFLVKLKDRFSPRVTLESSDIEEICWRRFLEKSPEGEKTLEGFFAASGSKLRLFTQLENCALYDAPLDKNRFQALYPFLPSHLKLLLGLVGELSKRSGGVGLRSAIKVVQDVLTGGGVGGDTTKGLISRELGSLVTGVWLYDVLQDDMEARDREYMQTVKKTLSALEGREDRVRVAKTLAVVNFLPDFWSSAKNIAALLQERVEAAVDTEAVETILRELSAEPSIPVSSRADGTFHYLNEAWESYEEIRRKYVPPQTDVIGLRNELLTELLKKDLKVTAFGSLTVSSSLCELSNPAASIFGKADDPLNLTLALYNEGESARNRREAALSESLGRHETLYLVAPLPSEIDESMTDILRSRYMAERLKGDVKGSEYARDQAQKAENGKRLLSEGLLLSLSKGEMIGKGAARALVDGRGFDEQVRGALAGVAEEVFHKYPLAKTKVALRTGSSKFVLHAAAGKPLEKSTDPLGLIDTQGERLKLNSSPAAQSLLEALSQMERRGSDLLERFASKPYGWPGETTQYILAALFATGEIELNISGRTHTTLDAAVEDVFKSPKNFKNVGLRIREGRMSDDDLFLLFGFLTTQGVSVRDPEEKELSEGAKKFLSESRIGIGSMLPLLKQNRVWGEQALRHLDQELERLETGGLKAFLEAVSDPEKALESQLNTLISLRKAESEGLFKTISEMRRLRGVLENYPEAVSGPLMARYDALEQSFSEPSFLNRSTDCRQFVHEAEAACAKADNEIAGEFEAEQKAAPGKAEAVARDLGLTDEETTELLQDVSSVKASGREYASVKMALLELRLAVEKLEAKAREILGRRPVPDSENETGKNPGHDAGNNTGEDTVMLPPLTPKRLKVTVPAAIRDTAAIDELIRLLEKLKPEVARGKVEIRMKLEE